MSSVLQMPKIFVGSVCKGLTAAIQDIVAIRKCNWNVQVVDISSGGVLSSEARARVEEDAEVLLADVPVILDVIYSAKKLKWAASTWAGVEKLLQGLDPSQTLPCQVTRCGGAFNELMAEYVLGYIMAQERRIIEAARQQEMALWDQTQFQHYRTLRELTIGILGCGEIGSEVASLCRRVGMSVIGVTRTRRLTADTNTVSQWKLMEDLPEVLAASDYICNILPSTPQTRDVLSGDMLSHCKSKKGVFINIGRGDVVDEASLVRAINKKSGQRMKSPGVRAESDKSGQTRTSPGRWQVAESFVNNYIRYCEVIEDPTAAQKPLDFIVDIDRGY